MPNNRHPVDALSDCRQQLKQLREVEAKLRDEVLGNPADVRGDENEAKICQHHVERIDVELMRQELGTLFLKPYIRETTVTRVQIKPRTKTRRKT